MKQAKMYIGHLSFIPLLSLVQTHDYSLMGGIINNMKLDRLTVLLVCTEADLEVNAKKKCFCPVGRMPNKSRI